MWVNILISLILLGIAAGIILYLFRAKKRGQTCIGCPYAKNCGGKCSGDCDPNNISNGDINT